MQNISNMKNLAVSQISAALYGDIGMKHKQLT